MRTFDFAPFYRSTVGFDRVFSTLDQLVGVDGSVPSYPPYNIARTDENAYRIAPAAWRRVRMGARREGCPVTYG